MPIADFIREHGFRHDYLAAQMGVTKTHFSRLITGTKPLTVARIYQLAAVMRLPVRTVAAAVIPEIEENDSCHAAVPAKIKRQRRKPLRRKPNPSTDQPTSGSPKSSPTIPA